MRHALFRILLVAGAAALAGSVQAGSLVASSADAGVDGSRGSSESVKTSNNSSAKDDRTAAIHDGAYRVAAVDPVADAANAVLLTLDPQGIAGAQRLQLEVPAKAFDGAQPQAGEIVQAQRRNYGVQLARGPLHEPFFMVMNDATSPELASRPLTP